MTVIRADRMMQLDLRMWPLQRRHADTRTASAASLPWRMEGHIGHTGRTAWQSTITWAWMKKLQ